MFYFTKLPGNLPIKFNLPDAANTNYLSCINSFGIYGCSGTIMSLCNINVHYTKQARIVNYPKETQRKTSSGNCRWRDLPTRQFCVILVTDIPCTALYTTVSAQLPYRTYQVFCFKPTLIFTGRTVNIPRTECFQKNNTKACSLLYRGNTNVVHPKRNSQQRKP